MVTLLILIVTEILTYVVIRQHFYEKSWMRFYFFFTLNLILSIWLWILWFESASFKGIFDEPEHIWVMLNLAGMIVGVVLPRIVVSSFHFTGVFLKRKTGGHNRLLTNIGFTIAAIIFLFSISGALFGRFNFKTERHTVLIKGLNPDLNGLKIIQISDLHMASFYHHKELLKKVMEKINSEHPDLFLNTGDFVTFGWREFDGFDTIYRIPKAKYGNYAILGNHDVGTYDPDFTEADIENNILLMKKKIADSGYKVLDQNFSTMDIGSAHLAIIGLKTWGSFTHISHGNVNEASAGLDSVDLKILLTHDPNQWINDVAGKTDIRLTLSGHTHGMQFGIVTKSFRWSPAVFFYPRWNGLYREGNQYLYVNRGLGVLGIPFRIGMPPEITILTLKSDGD
jgi:hypothetical protein